MNVYRKRSIFRRRNESNFYRMFLWVVLILGGIWLILSVQRGEIKPLFLPTPTPTRQSQSYSLEGDALFTAGKLEDTVDASGAVTSIGAITAYKEALRVAPNDAQVWAKLARIQTYSTRLLTTDAERKERLAEALASIDQGVAIAPDDSLVHAIRAFVLDWNANKLLVCTPEELTERSTCSEFERLLTEAEQEAVRALQLDNTNTLALAFYAEILVDQQKWTQADQIIQQALERDASQMDVHRVDAYVRESFGQYNLAIEAYDRAIAIEPNMTFLHLQAGANYRRLAFDSPNEDVQRQLYEKSLEYFAECARINEQIGVKDPVPYISIAKTYSQMGEFFIAIRNIQRALEFEPANADIYGQLGTIFYKNRNYEGSILALRCALRGCSPEESCEGRGGCGDNDVPAEVEGLGLSASTLDYYIYYGSALALLGPRDSSYCPESMNVMGEIRAAGFASDPITAKNVEANELICVDLVSGVGNVPVATSTEVMPETPTPTP
jgi:tetratricopeptide (TPR) repeat protein